MKKMELKKARGFVSEFKVFISRGNVVDMAVGIIIGTAFTGIVNSLVKDVIMPFVGIIIGGVNFNTLKFVITPATADTVESAIYYGTFFQKVVDFLIISFVVFLMIKLMNSFRRKQDKTPPPVEEKVAQVSEDVKLLTEIRDLLKQ
ncbi:MAG: large-conductance mechanosensitive channel protein MscL, partial [Oscillospiraceae bacterium]